MLYVAGELMPVGVGAALKRSLRLSWECPPKRGGWAARPRPCWLQAARGDQRRESIDVFAMAGAPHALCSRTGIGCRSG